jgi:hypothetical protein
MSARKPKPYVVKPSLALLDHVNSIAALTARVAELESLDREHRRVIAERADCIAKQAARVADQAREIAVLRAYAAVAQPCSCPCGNEARARLAELEAFDAARSAAREGKGNG